MKIVKLKGGLGNQMFEIAFGKILELKNNDLVKYDKSGYKFLSVEKIFGISNFSKKSENLKFKYFYFYFLNKEISLKYLEFWFLRKNLFFKNKKNYYFEINENKFKKELLYLKGDIYYEGYFQSYKYFDNYSKQIQKLFNFPKFKDKKNLSFSKLIKSSNSVSLHIRRGDYLNKTNYNYLGSCCDLDYYNKSIDFISENVENPVFFIFSDDITWCREKFKDLSNKYFIDYNKKDYLDMHLMSLCKNNIISNSSFSWWAAWLNKNKSKLVVSPKFWVKDIPNDFNRCPKSWKRL